MLTPRYMTSLKNVPAIMKKIVDGTAPSKFTVAHLKGLGFKSSNDQGIIPILKELKFLAPDGTPTPRYHEYRDPSRSKYVMAEALREAYEDVFHINARPSEADSEAIRGKFKSSHNATDRVAEQQARTFFALLKLADLDHREGRRDTWQAKKPAEEAGRDKERPTGGDKPPPFAGLRYNIEIHLPASKEIEVYNAIFKSLKEHLLG